MEENIDKNLKFQKLIICYKNNKFKIYSIFGLLIISIFIILYLGINKKKENIFVSEKYIEAGIYLTTNQSDKAKQILKDIIYKKDKFYSVLSLNLILEKNLEIEKDEILKYFSIIESLKLSKDQKDLVKFKKGLYLLKMSDPEEGYKLLKQLVNSDSNLKKLAQEVLNK